MLPFETLKILERANLEFSYSNDTHPQICRHKEVIETIDSLGLDKQSYILDIGCGNAGIEMLLTQKGFTNLYGVDWLDFKNIKYFKSLSHYQKVDLNAQNWNKIFLMLLTST